MNARILIVDDEQSIRESLGKLLRAEGWDIVLAENDREAIEKISNERIDLMLLDLGLPINDGWTLLKWLTEFNPSLPVIIITGRWKQDKLAEEAGADVLMEKPLDVTRLLQNIRELIEEPAETRVRRIRNRKHGFHRVNCDADKFREKLEDRYTAPFRFKKWFRSKRCSK
jgi:DNA-binding response OmpR family regulator